MVLFLLPLYPLLYYTKIKTIKQAFFMILSCFLKLFFLVFFGVISTRHVLPDALANCLFLLFVLKKVFVLL